VTQAVFLDSSAWFATLSPRDQWHEPAVRHYTAAARSGAPIVTTTLVLAEVHALLLRWRDSRMAARFLHAALTTPAHETIAPDVGLTRDAVEHWIDGHADQSFTLCDAVSFEIMRTRGIRRALAFDPHFAAAGFDAVGEA
jgi:predicted nucleic acid-binding protein